MDILRILPKGETIENIIESFRNTLISSKCEHSAKISVFLVTKEKFERSWNLIYPNNKDSLLMYERASDRRDMVSAEETNRL